MEASDLRVGRTIDGPTVPEGAVPHSTPEERTRWIAAQARAIGFDLCGVASADALQDPAHWQEWIARGYAGEMKYLYDARRGDPRQVLETAKNLIVVALNYNAPKPLSTEAAAGSDAGSPSGWISRYAWGGDYHEVLLGKLEELAAAMRAEFREPFEARAYVDTGPILERLAAKFAGFGWLAKNTLLINQQLGSWLFLGVILTTLDLAPSVAPGDALPRDLCGSCTRCLDACPTKAFPEPYVLDARRCISYLTIELRGAIPEDLRPAMGRHVFGCDICQDVCPWNRKSPATQLAAFLPREFPPPQSIAESDAEGAKSLFAPDLEWLAGFTQEQFSALFRASPIKRAKWRGLVRNACVALGNSKIPLDSPKRARVMRLLQSLAASEDSLIREHALWALARLEACD
jgi:epoxyqueuosine reductase